MGFANDYCNKGTLWDPNELVIINNSTEAWHHYRGDYSISNEISNNLKNLYSMTIADKNPETNLTTNFVKRLFYMYPSQYGYD